MTLLIGILCSDGAVIAADRQASHGALGTTTVGQQVTKVSIIGPDVLFACSGRVGMGQQFEAFITQLRDDNYFVQNKYSIAIGRVQQHFRPIVEGAFKTAGAAIHVLGQQAAQSDCICGGLLAAPFKDGMKLVEISPQIAVEFLTPSLSFISMGSGKLSADPFLGFLKSIFWPDRLPSVRESTLAAYWTIKLATDLRVSGVGMGTDIFVLEQSSDTWTARALDQNETSEHDIFIETCQSSLRAVASTLSGASPEPGAAEPTPPMPTP
jgi:hypothetical protein